MAARHNKPRAGTPVRRYLNQLDNMLAFMHELDAAPAINGPAWKLGMLRYYFGRLADFTAAPPKGCKIHADRARLEANKILAKYMRECDNQ